MWRSWDCADDQDADEQDSVPKVKKEREEFVLTAGVSSSSQWGLDCFVFTHSETNKYRQDPVLLSHHIIY